jgi:hypothetical protein
MGMWRPYFKSADMDMCEVLSLNSNASFCLCTLLMELFKYRNHPQQSVELTLLRNRLSSLMYLIQEVELPIQELVVVDNAVFAADFIDFCLQLPPIFQKFKRVFFHSLWHSRGRTPTLVSIRNYQSFFHDFLVPVESFSPLRTLQIPFNPPEAVGDARFRLVYDQEQHAFEGNMFQWMTEFNNREMDCTKICLRLKGEPARGRSVYETVLHDHWNYVLRRRWLYMNDEGHVEIMAQLTVQYHHEPVTHFFYLGLLSAMAVRQGLYLPFSLTTEFWKHLLSAAVADPPDMAEIYRHRIAQFETMGEFNVLKEQLGAEDSNHIHTYLDLFIETQAPDADALLSFLFGWKRANSPCVSSALTREPYSNFWTSLDPNAMFVHQETPQKITAASLVKQTILRHATKASLWSEFVALLSERELQQLVYFITGKHRLPCTEIGESQIHVEFHPYNVPTLPTSQLCFNTLHVQRVDSAEELYRQISPIFRFDTCFGFA